MVEESNSSNDVTDSGLREAGWELKFLFDDSCKMGLALVINTSIDGKYSTIRFFSEYNSWGISIDFIL